MFALERESSQTSGLRTPRQTRRGQQKHVPCTPPLAPLRRVPLVFATVKSPPRIRFDPWVPPLAHRLFLPAYPRPVLLNTEVVRHAISAHAPPYPARFVRGHTNPRKEEMMASPPPSPSRFVPSERTGPLIVQSPHMGSLVIRSTPMSSFRDMYSPRAGPTAPHVVPRKGALHVGPRTKVILTF